MADAMPESAVSLAQEYIATNAGDIEGEYKEEDASTTKLKITGDGDDVVVKEHNHADTEYENTIELVTRIAEVAPHQTLDMAVAVVSAVSGSAAEVAAAMQRISLIEVRIVRIVRIVHKMIVMCQIGQLSIFATICQALPWTITRLSNW
ncbi:MAG: hypothetical protein ACJAV1_000227 [Paraglaciecola sp.]|jgi:hypothetical protein